MKRYYKVMLGRGSVFAEEAKAGEFIGADFGIRSNLMRKLSADYRDFSKEFIPIWLAGNPGKTKIGAGLACGQLWTIAKGIQIGDTVLSPTGRGSGTYMVGEVLGEYEYHDGQLPQHQRKVRWFTTVDRQSMSESLRNSSGGITTVINLDKYAQELETLIKNPGIQLTSSDETVEDPTVFALEKHLEDFLVHNWKSTELGKNYDVYEQDGEIIGRQYLSDTGPIDILAISKDRKEILVVELKKGRISDVVVGQIQRYMGYIQDELAEKGQTVKGVIIALEDDLRLRRALSVARNIEFMTYEVTFKLNKV
jgi:restriction system protein